MLEQRLTAAAVRRLGAGLVVSPSWTRQALAGKLDAVATEPGYAAAARRLAAKYAAFDPAAQVGRMEERVEGLLAAEGRARVSRPANVFALGRGWTTPPRRRTVARDRGPGRRARAGRRPAG